MTESSGTDLELLAKDFIYEFRDPESVPNLNVTTIIYEIRNILIHNYFKHDGDTDTIKKIVDHIEMIIIDLL